MESFGGRMGEQTGKIAGAENKNEGGVDARLELLEKKLRVADGTKLAKIYDFTKEHFAITDSSQRLAESSAGPMASENKPGLVDDILGIIRRFFEASPLPEPEKEKIFSTGENKITEILIEAKSKLEIIKEYLGHIKDLLASIPILTLLWEGAKFILALLGVDVSVLPMREMSSAKNAQANSEGEGQGVRKMITEKIENYLAQDTATEDEKIAVLEKIKTKLEELVKKGQSDQV